MLTPEEETARAVRASQLYNQPLPSETQKRPMLSFVWKPILINAFFLPLPFLVSVAATSAYLKLGLDKAADIGPASLIYAIALMAGLAIGFGGIHHFYQTLDKYYLGTRVSFWLSLLGVTAVTCGAYTLNAISGSHTAMMVIDEFCRLVVVLLPGTYVFTVAIVFLCDRLALRQH